MGTYSLIRRVLITEKSTVLREEANQYVFEVATYANKIEIARAIEKIFKVKVVGVQVLNILGKKVRIAKFGGRLSGKKRSWKKAIVKLAPGNKIEVMEGL